MLPPTREWQFCFSHPESRTLAKNQPFLTKHTVGHVSQRSRPITDGLTAVVTASEVPVLLLTNVGATRGRSHTTPEADTCDGDRLVLMACKAGAPTHPAWYHHGIAHPEPTIA